MSILSSLSAILGICGVLLGLGLGLTWVDLHTQLARSPHLRQQFKKTLGSLVWYGVLTGYYYYAHWKPEHWNPWSPEYGMGMKKDDVIVILIIYVVIWAGSLLHLIEQVVVLIREARRAKGL